MSGDRSARCRGALIPLASSLLTAVISSGCGGDSPPVSNEAPKEALKRQNEMFKYMQSEGKVKAPKAK
jgi:hypothetical protein